MKQVFCLKKRTKTVRVGIVGTAKNTGKTTVLIALMNEARRRAIPVALTGIGYDGEAIDNLTLLPKPRLDVYEGIHLCTAEECVRNATAPYEVIAPTDEMTSLGRVLHVRITGEGRIMLAGPNKTDALRRVLILLEKYAPIQLIDGALGRMVPMTAADTVVFTTGAARSTNIPHLAEEMKAIMDIFQMGEEAHRNLPSEMPDEVTIYGHRGTKAVLAGCTSLLADADAASLSAKIKDDVRCVAIPGAVASKPFRALLNNSALTLKDVLFDFASPTMLLAGGNPIEVRDNLEQLLKRGAHVHYYHPIRLIAVAINPFFPRQVGRRGHFKPDYVNAEELEREFKTSLSLPIFNILKDGAGGLFYLLMSAF